MAIEAYKRYRLYLEIESPLRPGKKSLEPIGCEESTLEKARSWLKAEFDIWKIHPNAKYRIKEIIYWKPTESIIEEGIRKS